MTSEYHLFIIWKKATKHYDDIIDYLGKKFEIVEVTKFHWTKKNSFNNLCRFYGNNILTMIYKQLHCGSSPFIMIVVRDSSPLYQERKTLHGAETVNTRIFDTKIKLRKLTGGGHKVHGTNSPEEFAHDYFLLTGKDPETIGEATKWDGKIKNSHQDLAGANGWESMEQFLCALNNSVEYVILRNYDNLPSDYTFNGHNDIDILCKNKRYLRLATNAKRVHRYLNRVLHIIKISGEKIPFDFRSVGDGYYCRDWGENILTNRIKHENGFFIPEKKDYFYSLLYHALVHKYKVSEDYKFKLNSLKNSLDTDINIDLLEEVNMSSVLDEFMKADNYTYVECDDQTVHFNHLYTGRKPSGLVRRALIPVYRKIKEVSKNILWAKN